MRPLAPSSSDGAAVAYDSRMTESSELHVRERIVAAARECFLSRGVAKTRIADVASGAGVVRQTVYDWVAGRDELVDLALAERTRELAEVIRRRPVDPRGDIGEQIVDVLLAMIDLAGDDAEFELLAQAMPEAHAFAFIAGPSALTDMVELMLEPYFDIARERGVLREGLGTRALAAWVQLVLAPMRYRAGFEAKEMEERVRYFLIPSLLSEQSVARP